METYIFNRQPYELHPEHTENEFWYCINQEHIDFQSTKENCIRDVLISHRDIKLNDNDFEYILSADLKYLLYFASQYDIEFIFKE